MIALRLSVAILMVSLSACSGQVAGIGTVPAAQMQMRGLMGGVRAMPSGGVRAMPGGGVRAMPADGQTIDGSAPSADSQTAPVAFEGPNPIELHAPTLP